MTMLQLHGSCLCGSVQYEVEGDAVSFYHCHCQRCRKATGTGHASNIRVSPEACIRWTAGEELLSRFKVPEAERFFNCFCIRCGSPMPRVVPELEAVVVPAGTIDSDLAVKPQARIFRDSRADWSCEGDQLPCYPEYISS